MRVSKHYVDQDRDRDQLLKDLVEANNSRDGVVVKVKTPATANQEFPLLHRLGRVPTEVIPLLQGKAGSVYASSQSKWTEKIVYLKYSVAEDELTLRLR